MKPEIPAEIQKVTIITKAKVPDDVMRIWVNEKHHQAIHLFLKLYLGQMRKPSREILEAFASEEPQKIIDSLPEYAWQVEELLEIKKKLELGACGV